MLLLLYSSRNSRSTINHFTHYIHTISLSYVFFFQNLISCRLFFLPPLTYYFFRGFSSLVLLHHQSHSLCFITISSSVPCYQNLTSYSLSFLFLPPKPSYSFPGYPVLPFSIGIHLTQEIHIIVSPSSSMFPESSSSLPSHSS